MSHTNETTYYGLPQYVGSDIINPLVDTNGAYEQIDTVMHNVATAASGAVTDASDAKTAVENMENTVEGHTASIEANSEAIADVSGVIAPNFDSGETYAKGDIVIYTDGKAYQFTTSHSGAWTGLDVNRVVVGNAIKELEDNVSNIDTALTERGDLTTLATENSVQSRTVVTKTVADISDFKYIYIGTFITASGDRMNPILVPVSLFKDIVQFYCSAYSDTTTCGAKYVNDTTIEVFCYSSEAAGYANMFVAGIK